MSFRKFTAKIDIKSRKNKIENVERLKSQTNEQAENLFRAQEKNRSGRGPTKQINEIWSGQILANKLKTFSTFTHLYRVLISVRQPIKAYGSHKLRPRCVDVDEIWHKNTYGKYAANRNIRSSTTFGERL